MGRFPKPLSSLYPQETSHYYEGKTRLTEDKIATSIYGKFSLMALEVIHWWSTDFSELVKR